MSIETELMTRAESKCELCNSTEGLDVFKVDGSAVNGVDSCVWACATCREQIASPKALDVHHWRCLNDSMWTSVPAVQVQAWRMLKRLGDESWAQDLFEMLYLDDDVLDWAQQGSQQSSDQEMLVKHLDCNGGMLEAGDTVTLTKDLNVKGTSFTAKRGTAVRGISLVPDNAKQIEGRISGQQIVILTEFVKKTS